MRRLSLCVIAVFVLLTGCKRDISGTYLASDNSTVVWLQLVKTPDNHLSGQLAASVMKPDGSIDRKSVAVTGAVDGENVTLTATGFLGLQTTTLSGTFEDSNLTLTGVEPTPFVLKRSSLADYEAQVSALNARSQNIIASKAAAESRQRTERAQMNFVAQIDQLIANMQRFDSEADVHLGRFPNIEKGYEGITAKVNGYVERERQLTGSPNAAVARSQLSVDATQASLATDQLHNQGELFQSTFETNVKPIAAEVTTFEQRCQTVPPDDEIKAACVRLVNAAPPFRERYNAIEAGLAHLEQVYMQEHNTQQRLLQAAQRLQ
jgi:hypothetical protein